MNNLSSLRALGLDPSAFRTVHEDEMAPDADHGSSRHSDGSTCDCPCECVEVCDAEWDSLNQHRFPH